MRLQELIDFEPRKSTKTRLGYNDRTLDATDASKIGGGAFGSAYDTKSNKRLNQVTKLGRVAGFDDNSNIVSRSDIRNDGYLSYLKSVQEYNEERSPNPYFPVIHDLKIMKDAHGKLHYRANLEKLVPFFSDKVVQNEELMNSLYERMFGETYSDDRPIADAMALKLTRGLDNPDIITDKKLRSALALINKILETNPKFMDDMHGNNIMWRITGTMPQLVILDPIA